MRKLLILPLLAFLTGCVTYYYPETALEDGVYYAEDDPSYVVYSGGYADVAYYPWSSLDYFYLGYDPYSGNRHGYGYRFSGGGPLSWHYPHHECPRYWPCYAPYPAWTTYGGYYPHRYGGHNNGGHNNKKKHEDGGQDRYAGNDDDDQQIKPDGNRGRGNDAADRRDGGYVDSSGSSSVRRYVSTTPVGTGSSGNRGMVIRSREDTKASKTRPHLDKKAPASSTKLNLSGSSSSQSASANSARDAPRRTSSQSNARRSTRSQAKAAPRSKSRSQRSSSHSKRESSSQTSPREKDRN